MAETSYPDTRLLIDNQWRDAAGSKTLDVLNPASGERIGRVAHASTADLDQALEAARRGFEA
jgi:succinate-semialdehyde dehydrogenase/glutarate-semialdehyde dehydrogenase